MARASTAFPQPLSAIESTQRIVELDRKLKALAVELKNLRQVNAVSPRWWHDSAGRFENDPVFDEIVRLGRETRTAREVRSKGKRARSRH